MKFINTFRSKENDIDENSILSIVDKRNTRISYLNIHGDEESCELMMYPFESRSTGDAKNITRYYIYDNQTLKYIIRLNSKKLVYYNSSKITSISDDFIRKVTTKLGL